MTARNKKILYATVSFLSVVALGLLAYWITYG